MWPMPRAPISATRKRVVGVTRQTVSGTPISPLSELTGATVSATDDSTDARRSLTLVLPDDAGDAHDAQLGGPVDDAARDPRRRRSGRRRRATHGTPSTGREVSAATAPAATADATKSWPSAVSPTRAT